MKFKNANVFLEDQGFTRAGFAVENGIFSEIRKGEGPEDGIDLQGQYVIPGLIDIHTHGNSGADFSDGDYEGLKKMARYLAENGVTGFAPASMTLPYDVLERQNACGTSSRRTVQPCSASTWKVLSSPKRKRAPRTEPICGIRTGRPFSICMRSRTD